MVGKPEAKRRKLSFSWLYVNDFEIVLNCPVILP
jgi:hypothetical protein